MTDAHFNPPGRGWHSRGYLPHLDLPGLAQFLTFRQADSVPARLLRAYQAAIDAAKAVEASERSRRQSRVIAHLEAYLGKGRGSCRLRDPRAARIVEDALLFRQPRDYELIAWIVMPNHVHAVIRRRLAVPLEVIVRRWKAWTARWINDLEGAKGRFWQPETYDHWLRDDEDLSRAIRYVELNPVRAGLCASPLDWTFSSARRHPERWGDGSRTEGGRDSGGVQA